MSRYHLSGWLASLDDRALAGVVLRLPVEELIGQIESIVGARRGLDLEVVSALEARLAQVSAAERELLRAQEEGWRRSLTGRWLLAKKWSAEPERLPAAIELWSELVEQCEEHVAEAFLARARARREAGDFGGCAADLAECARRTLDYGILSRAGRLLDRLSGRGWTMPGRQVRVALASSTTIELMPSILRLICLRDGLAAEVHCAPFGTWRQELLDEKSSLRSFQPDFVVIAIHWRDANLAPLGNGAGAAERIVAELKELWASVQRDKPCTVLQHAFDFPAQEAAGYLAAREFDGRAQVLADANLRLFRERSAGVIVVDCPRLAAAHGTAQWSDDALWHVAKQHPSPSALPKLADRYTRLMAARLGLARKVAVVDLDNTLWGGVVGEDGVHGIKIGAPTAVGEAHAALQRYLRELKQRGVLLAVCSKNNESDAHEPFTQTLGMELKLEDFAAFFANWDEKPENLKRIAQSLNVGMDSLVFIDDNPLERAKVRREIPEVAVVELPRDPAGFVAAVDGGAYFEAVTISTEDLARHESYAANSQRTRLRDESGDVESFLRKLDMRMHHGPFNDVVAERVVQLFNKTNQFNLTTRRHGAAEVAQMRADAKVWTQYFRLVDCFGDNGVIGLVVAQTSDAADVWEIDSFLMSCRVLGRQAEEFMLSVVLAAARSRGIRLVRGRFIPTAKNIMVADLYLRLGFIAESRTESGESTWVWDLDVRTVPSTSFVRSAGP